MSEMFTELVQAERISDGKWRMRWRLVETTQRDEAVVDITLMLQRGPGDSVSDVERRCATRAHQMLSAALRDLGVE